MRASENGHLAMVDFLIKNKAEVNACDKSMQTALLWAALRGHDVTLLEKEDKLGGTCSLKFKSPKGRGVKPQPELWAK